MRRRASRSLVLFRAGNGHIVQPFSDVLCACSKARISRNSARTLGKALGSLAGSPHLVHGDEGATPSLHRHRY
jgi:hypothetical protein